jgi:hypothetical protein
MSQNTGDNLIVIKDSFYTTAADFKAAMSGVLLYYELAEPIEVDIPEELNMTYEAWDFGTEELVAKGATTPLNADIVYQFNAVDRIRENSSAIENLEGHVEERKDDGIELLANGNLKLTLKGETMEFMRATPSGDPMHWAYVSAGAEYNATDEYILKDAPWKDMVDTIEDKAKWGLDVVDASKVKQMTIKGVEYNYATENRTSPEGGTYLRYFLVGKGSNGTWVEDETKVLHLPGHWYLNGLGDITNAEMRRAHNSHTVSATINRGLQDTKARTLIFNELFAEITLGTISIYSSMLISIIGPKNGIMITPAYFDTFLGKSTKYCYTLRWDSKTGVNYSPISAQSQARVFYLKKIEKSVKVLSKYLSKSSIMYMIDNAAPTTAITITLHADRYAQLVEDADIVAALAAKPLVTLVSA